MTIPAVRPFSSSFWFVVVILVAPGLFAWDVLAYYLIVIPALLPTYCWVRAGAPGLPSLPVLAGLDRKSVV